MRLAGVEIGTVGKVERDVRDSAVDVTVNLDEGVEVSSAVHASIRLRSLLGAKFVQLDDPGGGTTLRDGDDIPIERTEVAIDLDQLIDSLGSVAEPIDANAINRVLGSMATALDGKGEELGAVLDGLAAVAGEVAQRSADLDRLVVASSRLATAIGSRAAQLGFTVDDLAKVFGILEARRAELSALVTSVGHLAEQLTPLLHDNRDVLDRLLADVTTAVTALDNQRDRLDLALEQLPVLAERFTAITGQGPWVSVYFVGIVPGPYVMNPVDLGSADSLEPGEDGGIPRVWFEPPTLLPSTTVGGTEISTDDESPPPPSGYPGGGG